MQRPPSFRKAAGMTAAPLTFGNITGLAADKDQTLQGMVPW